MHIETRRYLLYLLSSGLFVASIVSASLSWNHWAYTINTCPGYNCECVLFGKSFADQFSGGETVFCQLIVFIQVPLFLIASTLSIYQGRRALLVSRQKKRLQRQKKGDGDDSPMLVLKVRTLLSRSGRVLKEGDVFVEDQEVEMEPPSHGWSVTLVVLSWLVLLVLSTVLVVQVTGYLWSCNEYKKTLIKLLKASGSMAQIISERLECTAIFDYMDYLQPKRKLHDPYGYERRYKMNTGFALFAGQMSLLKNLFVWVYLTIYNTRELKRRKLMNKQL